MGALVTWMASSAWHLLRTRTQDRGGHAEQGHQNRARGHGWGDKICGPQGAQQRSQDGAWEREGVLGDESYSFL